MHMDYSLVPKGIQNIPVVFANTKLQASAFLLAAQAALNAQLRKASVDLETVLLTTGLAFDENETVDINPAAHDVFCKEQFVLHVKTSPMLDTVTVSDTEGPSEVVFYWRHQLSAGHARVPIVFGDLVTIGFGGVNAADVVIAEEA